MIVKTLQVQKVIPGATLILTECGMAGLKNGDLLHCNPDFATVMLTKYPEVFKDLGHKDRPGEYTRNLYAVERALVGATAAPAVEPTPKSTPVNKGRRLGQQAAAKEAGV